MMFFKPSLNPKRVVNGCLSQSKAKVRLSPQSAAATGVSLSIREPCHLYNMSGRVHVKIYSRRNVFATISNTGISILYKKLFQSRWPCVENDQVGAKLRVAQAGGEVD